MNTDSSGTTHEAIHACILPFLALPAIATLVAFRFSELGWVLALIYLFPISQLVVCMWWVRQYRRHVKHRLARCGHWPSDTKAIYTRLTYEAAKERYFHQVIGVSHASNAGTPTGVVTAAVRNEFAFRWGSSQLSCEPHSKLIGTAETLFLNSLFHVYLLSIEYYLRIHPDWNLDQIADTSPGRPQPPELMALDRFARRIGQWFRKQLDDDQPDAQVFAKSELYLSHVAEEMRSLLSEPLSRGTRQLRREGSTAFQELLIRLNAVPCNAGTGVEEAHRAEDEIGRQVSSFAQSFHLASFSPYWIELVATAPRLVLLFLLVSQITSLDGISTHAMLYNHMAGALQLSVVSVAWMFCGLVGLALSTSLFGQGRFMRSRDSLSAIRRAFSSIAATRVIEALLCCGFAGTVAGMPGLFHGIPNLALCLPYLLLALLFVLELSCLVVTGNSLLAMGLRYHYGPCAVLGDPRVIGLYLLQYALFFAAGAFICVHVITYFEGWLINVADRWPQLRADMSITSTVAFTVLAATLGWLGFYPFRDNRRGRPPDHRDVVMFGSFVVLCGTILAIPFIGATLVGSIMLLIALCLMNHAIFTLIIGVAALATELGRGWRLLGWGVWTLSVTIGAMALEASSSELTWAEPVGLTSFSGIVGASWVILAVICGDAALAVPLGVLGLIALSPTASDGFNQTWGALGVMPFQLFAGVACASLVLRWHRHLARGARAARRNLTTANHGHDSESLPGCERRLRVAAIPEEKSPPTQPRLAICVTGGQQVASPSLQKGPRQALADYMAIWDQVIVPNHFPGSRFLTDVDGRPLRRDDIEASLAYTFQRESQQGRSLWGEEAIVIGKPTTPLHGTLEQSRNVRQHVASLLFVVDTREQATLLRQGLRIQQYIVSRVANDGSQRDTMWYLVRLARVLKCRQLDSFVTIYLQSNKSTNARRDEHPLSTDPDPHNIFTFEQSSLEFDERLAVLEYIRAATGIRGEVSHNHTFDSLKSGAQNGSSGTLHDATHMYVLDRNAHSPTLECVADDMERILACPELAVIHPVRTTTNVAFPVGSQADLGEHAASMFMKTLADGLGGCQGEMVGFGWGTIVRCPSSSLVAAFAHPEFPCRYSQGATFWDRQFGAIRGFLNLPHISEDYAQAITSAEGLKSLGWEPTFGMSTSMHYKLREHSRFTEFLAARPRWAGGGDAGQIGRDILIRQINEFGTDSVFMREMRRNRARYYILAPLAIANVLLTPALVMTGYTAFADMALLALMGIVANQVMTLHGLASYWNRAGLLGGVAIWLRQRLRDALLFAPLLLIEVYGVLETVTKGDRFGFHFRASGGGKMGDFSRNLGDELLANARSCSITTWILGTGICSLVLNLVAIWKLDLLNAIMLYPFVLFSVGLTLAPSIYAHRRGPRWYGARYLNWIPSLIGFVGGLFILWLFSISFGLLHRWTWEEMPLQLTGFPLRPAHVPLILGCWLSTLLLPGRKALVGSRTKTSWRRYNALVVFAWILVAGLTVAVAVLASATLHQACFAGALVGVIPLLRIWLLLRLHPLKDPFFAPNRAHEQQPSIALDYLYHLGESVRRTAVITLGALIWFAIVPVPAAIHITVFRHKLIISPFDIASGLLYLAVCVAILISLGCLSLAWQDYRNGRKFRKLFVKFTGQAREGITAGIAVNLIESHCEGFRTAVDTRAPRLAVHHLRRVAELLQPDGHPTRKKSSADQIP